MNLRQSKSVLLIFSYVFVMFLLPYVTLYGISALFNISDPIALQVYTNLVSYLVLVAITLLLFGKELLTELKEIKSTGKYLRAVLVGWIILWGCSILANLIVMAITQSEESSVNQQVIEQCMSIYPVLMGITTVLFAPLVEEVVFRYTIMKGFLNRPWIGIALSSFLFGMIHVISAGDFIYAIPYIAMGFALGYAYYKNQNIWYSIGVHLFQNLFSTIILISSMQ